MNELRDDLTIGEINAELKEDETFELGSDGASCITARNNLHIRPVPDSWLKPKIKKWVPKKVSDLSDGDILVLNGVVKTVVDIRGGSDIDTRLAIYLSGMPSSFYRHRDEFVTVEVEE